MHAVFASLWNKRSLAAGAGLVAFTAALAVEHAPDASGLAAEDITPELVAQAAVEAGVDRSGAWLIDFVEPEDGEGGSDDAIAALAGDLSLQPVSFYSGGEHLYRLADPSDALLQRLASDPLVEGIEPEVMLSLPESAASALDPNGTIPDDAEAARGPRLEPDDPMFRLQWHMEQIRAPEAWTRGTGEGVVVAVIDTGVAWKDAKGARRLPDLAGTPFTKGKSFVKGLPDGLDDHAHGSHVAGTIAQTTNNGIGVTGVAFGATIMPLKVLAADGRGSVGAIADAIRYAADNGAHVINMSLGGPLPSKVLAKAIEHAHGKGVTTVCAAGNERRSKVGYPAANAHSVAVAAVDYEKNPSFYTNWGKDIDVAAPGGDTRSDKNGDGFPDGVLQNTIVVNDPTRDDYLWFQGTSMASPHAAGVAALIVGHGVTNPDEVERVMKETAVHPRGEAWDERYGAGIIDAAAASEHAQARYAPERAGFAGLLGLLGLAGLGAAGATRRRWLGPAGLVAGVVVASGLLAAPLPYALASLGGRTEAFGSPIVLSAAVPLLATLLLLGVRPLRGLLAGLSLGYAALLAHGAVVLPTLVSGLPGGPAVDRIWLADNALLALALAHRISRRGQAAP